MFGSVRREVAFLLIIIFLLSGIFYLMLINFWFGIGIYHLYLYPLLGDFGVEICDDDEGRGMYLSRWFWWKYDGLSFRSNAVQDFFFLILKSRLINSLQRGRWKWLEFGYLSTWLIIKQDDRVINKNWKGQGY